MVLGDAAVVVVGCNAQTAVADGIEGHHRHIEVNEVGCIAVDGIEGAVVEVRDVFAGGQCATMGPVPLTMDTAVVP